MSYSTEDGTYCDYYVTKIVRARTEHRCTACKRTILPGHYYSRTSLKHEDQIYKHKRCGACEKMFQHLKDLGRSSDMHPMEDLDCGLKYESEWDGPPPDEIAALAFATDDEAGALLASRAPRGKDSEGGGG